MLSNCDTKVITSWFDTVMRVVVGQVCAAEQRGFVRGRSGHDNVLAMRAAMENISDRPDAAPSVLLLGQAQAFAPIFHPVLSKLGLLRLHPFLWEALRRQGVPPPVLRRLQGLTSTARRRC